eukprot:6775668-Prorocentrum_lima.AAC.1
MVLCLPDDRVRRIRRTGVIEVRDGGEPTCRVLIRRATMAYITGSQITRRSETVMVSAARLLTKGRNRGKAMVVESH